MREIQIAPSILACDFSRVEEEVKRVAEAGARRIHIDVMDGHFAPNLTVGPAFVKSLRPRTNLQLDVHLMVTAPGNFVDSFAEAGADMICFHIEARNDAGPLIAKIKSLGRSAGLVLNPKTPLESIKEFLDEVDYFLLMTVEPGFGGQDFLPAVLPKIKELRGMFDGDIEVDGGINMDTCSKVTAAGANILVAGTAVFGAKEPAEAMKRLTTCGT